MRQRRQSCGGWLRTAQITQIRATTDYRTTPRATAPNGGSAGDYLPGFAWFGAFVMGPTRERLSVCLFIGALGVNFRICR
jgi:hypothetical protein